MRSSDVTANGLAYIVGLRRCPLNATLRMIENLIRVLMWFITDAYSSFVFFEILLPEHDQMLNVEKRNFTPIPLCS